MQWPAGTAAARARTRSRPSDREPQSLSEQPNPPSEALLTIALPSCLNLLARKCSVVAICDRSKRSNYASNTWKNKSASEWRCAAPRLGGGLGKITSVAARGAALRPGGGGQVSVARPPLDPQRSNCPTLYTCCDACSASGRRAVDGAAAVGEAAHAGLIPHHRLHAFRLRLASCRAAAGVDGVPVICRPRQIMAMVMVQAAGG